MFNDCSESRLYRLGGAACNMLHMEFINNRLFALSQANRRLRAVLGSYSDRLREAIAVDSTSVQHSPSFYALVIHSHAQDRIFR